MAQEESAPLTGADVYNDAVTKEEPVAERVTEEAPTETAEAKSERVRDEKGRFAAKQQDDPVIDPQPEAVASEPEPEKVKEDHRVPLAELLNTRERAQKAEQEREMLRQHLFQMQSQLQALQAPKEEPIDMFAEPQKWEQTIEQRIAAKHREMEGNFSLRLAAYKHGDAFHEAWQDMVNRTQMGDDSVRQQVMQSPDPGETLVQLYKRERVVKEVGDDPNTYIQKKLEEALNDPEFLAKALEKAKGVASVQPTQQVKLPPSLNKATAAASATDSSPLTGQSIYSFATGR